MKVSGIISKKYINKVVCGQNHSLFLTHSGMIFSSGNNDKGQLGIGDENSTVEEPVLINSLLDYKISDIFAGKNHNIVYGTVRTTNKSKSDNIKGEIIFGWGDNSYGQLGLNTKKKIFSSPTAINTFDNINSENLPYLDKEIVCVTGGVNTTYVLFEGGFLYGFGSNENKQISLNDKEKIYFKPYLITYPFLKEKDAKIVDMMASANSMLTITDKNCMIIQGLITKGKIMTINIQYYGEDVIPYISDSKLIFFYFNKVSKKIFDDKVEIYSPKVEIAPLPHKQIITKMNSVKLKENKSNSTLNTSMNSAKANNNANIINDSPGNSSNSFYKRNMSKDNIALKEKPKQKVPENSEIINQQKNNAKVNKNNVNNNKPEINSNIHKKAVSSTIVNDRYKDYKSESHDTNQQTTSKQNSGKESNIKKTQPLKSIKKEFETEVSNTLNRSTSTIFDELFKDLMFISPLEKFRNKRFNKKIREDTSMYKSLISNWNRYKKDPTIKNLFYNGIPVEYRNKLWLLLIKNKFCITKEYFEIQLAKAKKANKNYKIVYPFKKLGLYKPESPLSEDLKDIITALLFSRPDLKNDECLSKLVGILLINLDKFQSFSSLVSIVLNKNLLCYYIDEKKNPDSIQEINQRIQFFRQIFYLNLPELCSFLEMNDIFPESYFIQWTKSLFSSYFNIDMIMRVWDVYFCEGYKSLYLISIAIMKYFQNKIMNMEYEDIVDLLENCESIKVDEDIIIDNIRHVKMPKWIEEEFKKFE